MSRGEKTYLDASVVIGYAKTNREHSIAAWNLVAEDRVFVASKLVVLEARAPSIAVNDRAVLAYVDFCWPLFLSGFQLMKPSLMMQLLSRKRILVWQLRIRFI